MNARSLRTHFVGTVGLTLIMAAQAQVQAQIFDPPINYDLGVGTNPWGAAAMDLDGDGDPDLVVVDSAASSEQVHTLLAVGNCTSPLVVGTSFSFQQSHGPKDLTVLNWNSCADQFPDIAATMPNGGHAYCSLLGDGAGGFQGPQCSDTGPSAPDSIAAGDFNGDGWADIVVARPYEDSLFVELGDCEGNASTTKSPPVGYGVGCIKTGSFDTGPYEAIVLARGNEVLVLPSNAGGFQSPSLILTVQGEITTVLVEDLDADGFADVAAVESGAGNLHVLLGDGAGGFAPQVPVPILPGGDSFSAGDFDDDGLQDLAITHSTLDVMTILLGNGTGSFLKVAEITDGLATPRTVVCADFDGDSQDDVAVTNYASGTVTVFTASRIKAYCSPGAPNSVSATGAVFSVQGCTSIVQNNLLFTVSDLPPKVPGIFYCGPFAKAPTTLGDGFNCVGGKVGRLPPVHFASPSGGVVHPVDLTHIQPGETWRFQYWYRDPQGGVYGNNTSNAVEITFIP